VAQFQPVLEHFDRVQVRKRAIFEAFQRMLTSKAAWQESQFDHASNAHRLVSQQL
jgi:hypothetical protein